MRKTGGPEWDRSSVAEPALLAPASFAVQSQPPLLALRLGANADPVVTPGLPPLSLLSPVFSYNPGAWSIARVDAALAVTGLVFQWVFVLATTFPRPECG